MSNLNLDLARELCERIINNVIPLKPRTIGRDSLRSIAVYEFSFQLLEVIKTLRNNKTDAEDTNSAIQLFKNILLSENVDTGTKFIILNSFANDERGRGGIHFRFARAFEVMLKHDNDDIQKTIKYVFDEYDKRYLSGNEIIYAHEENYFYLLYQGWSGKIMNADEIARIRQAALRGLDKHPDIIEVFWARFPYDKDKQNISELLADEHFLGTEKLELYMPLNTLIEISRKVENEDPVLRDKITFWERIINDESERQLYYQRCELRDSSDTLRAVLKKRQLIMD